MCGIVGFIDLKRKHSLEEVEKFVRIMNAQIVHRGPDDDGVWVGDGAAFGMRRLSIIDLKDGHQPIFNEDKSKLIVFNGEIYNYRKIRNDLIKKGHFFSTNSDTETALHAFEEYGEHCVEHLEGMYAFCIYDIINHRVVLFRDRAGEKPLYYFWNENYFIFASELKSIIETGIVEKSIDKEALAQYFQLTYIPSPLTIFKHVYKLPAGHYIKFFQGTMEIKKYWDMEYDSDNMILNYEQCCTMLRQTLFRSIEQCMVSDVPIGTFLSGGIDSTIITGIAARLSDKPIDTFTIGFKEKDYDESQRAEIAAHFHRTNHHIFYLDYDHALTEIQKVIENIDEPFADSSQIPTYVVSQFARKYVKVILTGDAGDELFAGYNKYLIGVYSKKYEKIPKVIRQNLIEKGIQMLLYQSSIRRKAEKVLDNTSKDIYDQRIALMCLGFKKEEITYLFNDYDKEKMDLKKLISPFYLKDLDVLDEISRTLYLDFKVVLEGDMLTKVDRNSMLASLETRVPMLSKEMLTLVPRIPIEYKINERKRKVILKETFADLIPRRLQHASKKGFGVPVDRWLNRELKTELLSYLQPDLIKSQGLFRYEYLRNLADEHFSGKRNRKSELWAYYIFQKWYLKYMV
ncbi:asparagine synthase (glutamine-hydrolyzing) [Ructibacterium gallinarum]|uniref:asparagine synthase (glutamine-hydrolyzing) n=1 Tax=Ructibacterium gallinarum TaxID=2779355 RepID=A0A9D5R7X2_9FIRM|nr:asparagine synthase (glutamine-hydrolyzing) [Ructibacterium gallinarum]MBE5039342.1 asparagine synthase (glutamine-hydrolyzing) [Ructibacterium gallinarum]